MDHVRDMVVGPVAGSAKKPPSEAAPQGQDPEWRPTKQVLQYLEESCGRVETLLEEVRGLHAAMRRLADLATSETADEETDETRRTPDLGGSTANLPIASILELLSANRKSGTVRMTSGGEMFTLEILEGDVVHASSDQCTQEQLLGSILVARDTIGVEQLEDFYKRYIPRSTAMDESMDGDSLVSREDLKAALEAQVQELFNRLYAAGSGTFEFYAGGSSNVEQRIRMNVTRLLLESARTKDELEHQLQSNSAEEAGTF